MSDHSLILGLESRLLNAWPSFDYQAYDGWILRLANGYTKRANSATPLMPGAALDEALLDHMVAQFIAANLRPTFRLNGLQAPEADALLASRHFKEIEPTHVLAAPVAGDCETDPEVTISPKVSKQWVHEASEAYGGDKADEASLMGIVSRIRQKAAFATLNLDDRPVAWGLGVVERGYIGLYDIVQKLDQDATRADCHHRPEKRIARYPHDQLGDRARHHLLDVERRTERFEICRARLHGLGVGKVEAHRPQFRLVRHTQRLQRHRETQCLGGCGGSVRRRDVDVSNVTEGRFRTVAARLHDVATVGGAARPDRDPARRGGRGPGRAVPSPARRGCTARASSRDRLGPPADGANGEAAQGFPTRAPRRARLR